MRSVKIDLKSANVKCEIVKYVVDDCRSKSAKMAELEYFEIGCKKTAF